jgi:SAM-dependent methyltransferase
VDGSAVSGAGVNAAQTESWNGDDGEHWVEHRERYEAMAVELTDRLLAAAAIEPGESVLDIGCGCGGSTRAAARKASAGRVLGVDVSEIMVAEARRVTERDGLANARFAVGDAQVYPFDPAGFDVAISRNGMMFFDDPRAAFANIAGALRPGGRLAVLCWQDPARNEFLTLPLSTIAAHVQLPDLGGDGPGPFSLADPTHVRELLTGAGFGRVSIEPVVGSMWIGRDVDDVVEFLHGLPMLRSLLARADQASTAAVDAALRAALRPHQSPRGVALGAAAWLVTGRHEPAGTSSEQSGEGHE